MRAWLNIATAVPISIVAICAAARGDETWAVIDLALALISWIFGGVGQLALLRTDEHRRAHAAIMAEMRHTLAEVTALALVIQIAERDGRLPN